MKYIVIALLFVGLALHAEEKDTKLSVDFTGLYLGCPMDDALAVMKASSRVKFKKIFTDKKTGAIYYHYEGNNQINNVNLTVLAFWNKKLMTIDISLNGNPRGEIYDAIKSSLEKKFGKMEEILSRDKKGRTTAVTDRYRDSQIYVSMGKVVFEPEITIIAQHAELYKEFKDAKKEKIAQEVGKF